MARYLTINSKFNPITFEERMKPLLLYKEEYENQEEALNKVLEESQSLADLKNYPQDSDVYRQYQEYQNSINGVIDNLTNNGTLDSKAALQLRRYYLQNLKPYESKLARRNELIRKQAENYTPDTMYDIDFSTVGINDINEASSFRTYKLNDIAKTAASRTLSKYNSGETVGSDSEETESILKDIDTTNLSNNQVNQIKSYIKQGIGSAKQAYNEYLVQQDYKIAQAEHLRRNNTNGIVRNASPKANKSYENVTLSSGERIKLEKRGDDYYYNGVKVDMENLNQLSSKYGNPDYAGLEGSKSYRKRGESDDIEVTSATFPEDIPPTHKAVARNMSELSDVLNKLPDTRDAIMTFMGKNGKIDGGLFVNGYAIQVGIKDGISYIKVYKNGTTNTAQQTSTVEEESNEEEVIDPIADLE